MNKLRSVIFLGCILLFPFLLGCNKVVDPSEMEDIILWLDAASISGLGDGDSVEVWNDLSGNGNDAVAVEPGAGPTYIESFHNGLAALGFNGIDDILVVAHNDQLNFGFDSFTIAVVYQLDPE